MLHVDLPNCLFQNSSYSAVAKWNETLLAGTKDEEQEGQFVWWQGPDECNSKKNMVGKKKSNQKREQEDTKLGKNWVYNQSISAESKLAPKYNFSCPRPFLPQTRSEGLAMGRSCFFFSGRGCQFRAHPHQVHPQREGSLSECANPQSNDSSCEFHDIKHWEGRG